MCRRRRAAGPGVALNLTNASQGERFPILQQATYAAESAAEDSEEVVGAGGWGQRIDRRWVGGQLALTRHRRVHPQDGPLRPAVQWTKSKR